MAIGTQSHNQHYNNHLFGAFLWEFFSAIFGWLSAILGINLAPSGLQWGSFFQSFLGVWNVGFTKLPIERGKFCCVSGFSGTGYSGDILPKIFFFKNCFPAPGTRCDFIKKKKGREGFFLKSDQTKCFDQQNIWVMHSCYVCGPVACASFIHGHDELKNVQGQNMVVDEKNNHESMAHRAMSRGEKRRRDDFSFNHPLPDDWPAKLGYK